MLKKILILILLCTIFLSESEAKNNKNYSKKFRRKSKSAAVDASSNRKNISEKKEEKPINFVEYYLLMDADTKEILVSKNHQEPLPPSSMTKLMTAYVVFDQIKKGNVRLDNICAIGKDAWRKSGSSMFLNYGDRVSIDELLQGLLAVSANDAAVALANSISGSIVTFADLMNITAAKLKMRNSHFKNPHGLYEDGHYASIYDLAILTSRIYEDFPEFAHYLEIPEFTYRNITQKNRNPLIRNNYDGIVGGKTGHTNQGGYGVVSVVKRNNRRLIAVVNKANTPRQRAQLITSLVDFGFNHYKKISLFSSGEEVASLKTWLGEESEVKAVTSESISFNIRSIDSVNKIIAKINYAKPIPAPIAKGQKIATLTIEAPGIKKIEVDLIAKEKVNQVGFIRKVKSYVVFISNYILTKIK